jgi:hypothetical protein
MRVRPLFWIVLCCVCGGVLLFAAVAPTRAPAVMRVSLAQRPALPGPAMIMARVTDTQGLPIEDAHLSVRAWMTNMDMATQASASRAEQQGMYLVSVRFSMAGPWALAVSIQAVGFDAVQQTVFVQVQASASSAHSSSPSSPLAVCICRGGEATHSVLPLKRYPGRHLLQESVCRDWLTPQIRPA